jgi:transposase
VWCPELLLNQLDLPLLLFKMVVSSEEATMFARVKKSGNNQYLQIVENRREKGKVVQRVITTLGRLDQMAEKGEVEALVRSLSRFSERTLLILSEKSKISASAMKIGPALIFERLWKELGIGSIVSSLVAERKFGFSVERALFLTVLHRLFVSGSDRGCEKWRRNYRIDGAEDIALHQLYRAMAFLGEEISDQKDRTHAPRCTKDVIEEEMFDRRKNLFTDLDFVFLDTTALYFEGEGGKTIGERGHSKDHRPDLNQMVVGALLDDCGKPIACEMWPGNTADVTSTIPVVTRLKKRFGANRFCIVADRGMISQTTMLALEEEKLSYILGVRMRLVKEVKTEVLADETPYEEVYPEGIHSKDPSPLKVKEVVIDGTRYIVCKNERQARRDEADRNTIVESLKEKIAKAPSSLISNKGYRGFVKVTKESVALDEDKINADVKFDGIWVLTTNTKLKAREVALKYKELWMVEHTFRDMKSVIDTRPIYHKRDETIRGHVFCSFLALVLKKELDDRLVSQGLQFEWADIKQDLKALQEVILEENGTTLAVRTECQGTCGKVFKATGVAVPQTIRVVQP